MTAFLPRWPLRHAQVQSALASFKPRNWSRRRHPMSLAAVEHLLDCGAGVRLQGFHSAQPDGRPPRGLVVLIHGWEGCHESVYLVSFACAAYDAGWNVFRLNLRDHGHTHHLNEEIFHSARLDEVLGAVHAIEALDPARPLSVIGFSLGGNFALRIGMRGPARGVCPAMTVGVSPALDPGATLAALDHGPRMFQRYFMGKWHRTMRAKAAAWPGRYDFSDVLPMTNFTEITRCFVERYTEFPRLEDYLTAYTLLPDEINASPTPLMLLTALDDPVVPPTAFEGIRERDGLTLLSPAHGGHCGFVEDFRLRSWAERRVLEVLPSS